MSILEDIVEETDFTPKNSKPVVKWVVRIAIILIGVAFAVGGFKETAIFNLKSFKKQVDKNTEEIQDVKKQINENKKLIDIHAAEIIANDKITNQRLDAFDVRLENFGERLENHIYNDAVYQRKAAKK